MDVSGRWLSCLPQLPMNDFSVLVTRASGIIAFALFKKNILKREIVLLKKKKKLLKNMSSPLVSSVPFPHFFFPEVKTVHSYFPVYPSSKNQCVYKHICTHTCIYMYYSPFLKTQMIAHFILLYFICKNLYWSIVAL